MIICIVFCTGYTGRYVPLASSERALIGTVKWRVGFCQVLWSIFALVSHLFYLPPLSHWLIAYHSSLVVNNPIFRNSDWHFSLAPLNDFTISFVSLFWLSMSLYCTCVRENGTCTYENYWQNVLSTIGCGRGHPQAPPPHSSRQPTLTCSTSPLPTPLFPRPDCPHLRQPSRHLSRATINL